MIFQPTNINPDIKGGLGYGTRDLTQGLTVEWVVNGNSPLLAFSITIYANDANSTLLYTTGQVTDDCPFYPVNYAGEQQAMSYTIDAATLSGANIVNGSEYKLIIAQWYGAGGSDYVEQSSASVFIGKADPTLTIDAIPAPLIARSYTFTATYAQAQGDALNWVRWQIASADDQSNPFYDTGNIYGTAQLQVSYDGFFTGNTYSIQCSAQTVSGVDVTTGWVDFDVDYPQTAIEGAASAVCVKGKNAVKVSFSPLSSIVGTGTGTYSFADGQLTLASGAKVDWDMVNGEAMHYEAPWSLLYKCNFNNSYANRNLAEVYTDYTWEEHDEYFGDIIKRYRLAARSVGKVTTIYRISLTLFMDYSTDSGATWNVFASYPITLDSAQDTSNADVTFYLTATHFGMRIYANGTAYTLTQSIRDYYGGAVAQLTAWNTFMSTAMSHITLDGVQKADYFQVFENDGASAYVQGAITDGTYTPIYDTNTIFLASFDNADLSAGNIATVANIEDIAIYRKGANETTLTHVANAQLGDTYVYDYGAQSQQGDYTYYVVPRATEISTKSTSGNPIATFEADGLPFTAIKANIVASQAGSGDPYPAGGGGNVMPAGAAGSVTSNGITFTSDGKGTYTIKGTATALALATFTLDSSFVIPPSSTHKCAFMNNTGVVGVSLDFMNGNTAIDNWGLSPANRVSTGYTAMAGQTCTGIRVGVQSGTTVDMTFSTMFIPQAASADTFIPYSNIRPISGYTGAAVTRTGKNLVPYPYASNSPLTSNGVTFTANADGTITVSGTATANTFFNLAVSVLVPAGTYTVKRTGNSALNFLVWNTGGTTLAQSSTADATLTLTEPTVVNLFLRANNGGAFGSGVTVEPQIELGSTAHDYEAYNGEVFSVSWQDEAGTVYGGTVDLVSGVLTVTHFSETFNGSETWAPFGAISGAYFHDLPNDEAQVNKDDIIGNYIVATSKAGADLALFETTMQGPAGAYYRLIIQTGCATLADWQTFLSNNNLQIVGKTTGTTVYTLSGQEIVSLLGQNNVWNDIGTVDTEYEIYTEQPAPLITNPLCVSWWMWTVLECTKDEDGFYQVLNAYNFRNNLTSGKISNNNSPNVALNFTKYPTVQTVPQNFKSGALQSLIGAVTLNTNTGAMEYADSLALRDSIYNLSTTTNPLFLKNTKGDLLKIKINGAIEMETSDNTRELMQTMELPWVEVGSTKGISIIGY